MADDVGVSRGQDIKDGGSLMTSKGPDYGETVFAQHLMPLESPNSIIIASRTKLDVMQSFA